MKLGELKKSLAKLSNMDNLEVIIQYLPENKEEPVFCVLAATAYTISPASFILVEENAARKLIAEKKRPEDFSNN